MSILADDRRIVTTDALTIECDEHNCREANSHPATCECRCGGNGHGIQRRALVEASLVRTRARIDRAGGIFALLDSMGGLGTDDGAF